MEPVGSLAPVQMEAIRVMILLLELTWHAAEGRSFGQGWGEVEVDGGDTPTVSLGSKEQITHCKLSGMVKGTCGLM